MGKATGFVEFTRSQPPARPSLDRVRDWSEFHTHLPDEKLSQQAARCMDCAVPFCHTGTAIDGLAVGCPINNLIPDWNDLVYRGNWHEALIRLHQTNNFPEFTGRVCPAPCEGSCVLGINESPVAIRSIECAIVDRGFAEGWIMPEPPATRTGKKVAIVGSGPAGLACAAQLNRAGHWVTVFERSDRIGGLLTYGIPNMKLDKGIVQRRVDLLAAEGVTFATGVQVGNGYAGETLRTEFDAAVLCTGSTKARDLPIPGRSALGIHFAMEFLETNTRSLLNSNHHDGNYLSAKDKDVIVIGGGDTGTDCVATALRHGCRSLVQFEILPQPPNSRAADNPWPQWPRVYRLDYGQEEAAAAFGDDPRRYQVMSKQFFSGADNRLTGLQTINLEWRANNGAGPRPLELENTEKSWPAQMVLLALGFVGPEKEGLLEQLGIELDARGNVARDENDMTNLAGVFAAGDMARGQSLVVWAIAEGRRAARSVDQYLMGESVLD